MKSQAYINLLDSQFSEIVKKIIPDKQIGYLFGEKIDLENTKELVVAAYYIAKQEETDKRILELKEKF